MGRLLHETAERKKGRRRGGYTNEGEADGAGGNKNHSGRGGKADKELEKTKAAGRDEVQNEAWMYETEKMVERMVELMNGVWIGRLPMSNSLKHGV
jgi:hypothetical protein